MKRRATFVSTVASCLAAIAATASAGGFATVSPSMLDLVLDEGDVVVEQVSLTIDAFCVRPIDVDLVASDPAALMTNLSGVLVNQCGGDTTTFDVQLTGDATPQSFDLEFVDAEFGGLLGSIPVTIGVPEPVLEPLLGVLVRKPAIVFQVSSSGCTTRNDFRVDVLGSSPHELTLVRLREDPCDAFEPLGTLIPFRYPELGIRPGAQLQVVNPLGVAEVPPAPAP